MKKLSFFKGLFIAGIFSTMFWVSLAAVIEMNFDKEQSPDHIQKKEINEETYAMGSRPSTQPVN